MKEQISQSKTGTFKACLQLPLHLEAPAALCKMLPESLKLDKAQQQSPRLACKPCWDADTMHFPCGLRCAALYRMQLQQVPCFLLPLHQSGELQREVLVLSEGGLGPLCQVGFSAVARPLPNSGLGCSAAPLHQVLWWRGPELKHTSPVGEELR